MLDIYLQWPKDLQLIFGSIPVIRANMRRKQVDVQSQVFGVNPKSLCCALTIHWIWLFLTDAGFGILWCSNNVAHHIFFIYIMLECFKGKYTIVNQISIRHQLGMLNRFYQTTLILIGWYFDFWTTGRVIYRKEGWNNSHWGLFINNANHIIVGVLSYAMVFFKLTKLAK